jgi:hypothetical protein
MAGKMAVRGKGDAMPLKTFQKPRLSRRGCLILDTILIDLFGLMVKK